MTTDSTMAILQAIRRHALAFVPSGGAALVDSLGGDAATARWWNVGAPDDAAYPFVVHRLMNQQRSGQNPRVRADLEVIIYGRDRSEATVAEQMADQIAEAMQGYQDASSGLVFSRDCQRDTLPVPTDPADVQMYQVRLLFEVVYWPTFLSRSANP